MIRHELKAEELYPYLKSLKCELPLLHQAVLSGTYNEIDLLLNAQAEINAAVHRQWTPLHFAALRGDRQIIKKLLLMGANPSYKNDWGGTYTSILKMTDLAENKVQGTLSVLTERGYLTDREYLTLTRQVYLSEIFFEKKRLLQEFAKPVMQPPQDLLFPTIHEQYRRFIHNRPVHMLKSVTSQKNEFGLFAEKEYFPGDWIGEYLGYCSLDMSEHSNYTLEASGPDGEFYGNEISRVNDGFPNLMMRQIYHAEGIPKRYVLIAIDHIQKGEQFIWNYGLHQVKAGLYQEMRPFDTRQFMRDFKVKPALKMIIDSLERGSSTFQEMAFKEKLRFIVQSPNVLFTLILEGIVSRETADGLLKVGIGLEFITAKSQELYQKCVETAFMLKTVVHQLEFYHPKLGSECLNFFGHLQERFELAAVLETSFSFIQLFQKAYQSIAYQNNPEFVQKGPQEIALMIEKLWNEFIARVFP